MLYYTGMAQLEKVTRLKLGSVASAAASSSAAAACKVQMQMSTSI